MPRGRPPKSPEERCGGQFAMRCRPAFAEAVKKAASEFEMSAAAHIRAAVENQMRADGISNDLQASKH
jgi:hypothetical protein